MTYQETVRAVFNDAKAVKEPNSVGGGYTVVADGNRLSWSPRAIEAWELAAGSIAVKRAYMESNNACDHYLIQGAW